jgi:hypothetical protein
LEKGVLEVKFQRSVERVEDGVLDLKFQKSVAGNYLRTES